MSVRFSQEKVDNFVAAVSDGLQLKCNFWHQPALRRTNVITVTGGIIVHENVAKVIKQPGIFFQECFFKKRSSLKAPYVLDPPPGPFHKV